MLGAGAQFGARPGFFARLFAPGLAHIVDRIDERLSSGAINAILPDGTRRTLGGHAPGFECEVHLKDWRALVRLATGGSVGWYQAWEAGEWDSADPVALFALFMANAASLGDTARAKGPWRLAARVLHALKRNTRAQAKKNIHAHYDLGNDFYGAWLDPSMTYSSAYRMGDDGLEAAQRRKWERLAHRLNDPASVLEIGCGWGSLAAHLARSVPHVEAISISDQQLAHARAHWPDVAFRKQDYRDVAGQYSRPKASTISTLTKPSNWPSTSR